MITSGQDKRIMTQKNNWPVEEGRYQLGNPQAPAAVCTEASVSGIKVNMDQVAIIGKCVTENVGIEKIVKNIITNPHIRFLIVCGKPSNGHDVGQTLLALAKHGVDKERRVIKSTGSIPLLRHLTKKEINRFRKQVLVVDMRGVTNSRAVQIKVEQCLKKNPGKFTGKPMRIKKIGKTKKIRCLQARTFAGQYLSDPQGSFLITVSQGEGVIMVQHYNADLEFDLQIVGQEAGAVTDTIIKAGLIGDFPESKDHAAYLGRELAKAEFCLKNGIDYYQDQSVKINTKKSQPLAKDDFGW